MESDALYAALERLNLLEGKAAGWWPGYGGFEVVVGAVLTQNAKWERVEVSLENLRAYGLLELEALATCKAELLQECIRPSGLFQNKSRVLGALAAAMLETFGDFETFTCKVTRSWLLARRGIGKESADAILCYACKRNVMTVDAYTHRLLGALGFEAQEYEALQSWFTCKHALDAAHYHGMIVEYMKRYARGKKIALEPLLPHL
ncbi:MAG: 3-methyladenine DNA glycosylase [Campylobacterales bacterium]|nr:3-methyladenine DNA glycosylase [Campylobacterales bacterium]